MTKEEFIKKMIELREDGQEAVYGTVCDEYNCDECPLTDMYDCEVLLIDRLCDMISDLQNKKAEEKKRMTKEELVNKLIELHRQTISDANRMLEALIEYMTIEEKDDDKR